MELRIERTKKTVDPLAANEPQPLFEPIDKQMLTTKVYLDNKVVPPELKRIILLGLDAAAKEYMNAIAEQMMEEDYE
jgi:hypothetical protein